MYYNGYIRKGGCSACGGGSNNNLRSTFSHKFYNRSSNRFGIDSNEDTLQKYFPSYNYRIQRIMTPPRNYSNYRFNLENNNPNVNKINFKNYYSPPRNGGCRSCSIEASQAFNRTDYSRPSTGNHLKNNNLYLSNDNIFSKNYNNQFDKIYDSDNNIRTQNKEEYNFRERYRNNDDLYFRKRSYNNDEFNFRERFQNNNNYNLRERYQINNESNSRERYPNNDIYNFRERYQINNESNTRERYPNNDIYNFRERYQINKESNSRERYPNNDIYNFRERYQNNNNIFKFSPNRNRYYSPIKNPQRTLINSFSSSNVINYPYNNMNNYYYDRNKKEETLLNNPNRGLLNDNFNKYYYKPINRNNHSPSIKNNNDNNNNNLDIRYKYLLSKEQNITDPDRFITLNIFNYQRELREILNERKTFFIFIYGNHDYTGKSWCSDCNIAMPNVEHAKNILKNRKIEKEVYFLNLPIDKINMEYLKNDPKIQLERVPTLIYFENGLEKNRLIENELFSYQVINDFILQPFEQYNPRRNLYLYQTRNYY